MAVEINNKVAAHISKQPFEKIFFRAQRILKLPVHANVSLVLVGQDEIKRINKQRRKRNKVTDVLSFSFSEHKKVFFISPDSQSQCRGEIIICYDRAKIQAKQFQHSLRDELKILFVHGLLHLAGYHHSNIEEKIRSNKIAKQILK